MLTESQTRGEKLEEEIKEKGGTIRRLERDNKHLNAEVLSLPSACKDLTNFHLLENNKIRW